MLVSRPPCLVWEVVAPAPVTVTGGLAPGPTFFTAPSTGSMTVGAGQVAGSRGARASWRQGLRYSKGSVRLTVVHVRSPSVPLWCGRGCGWGALLGSATGDQACLVYVRCPLLSLDVHRFCGNCRVTAPQAETSGKTATSGKSGEAQAESWWRDWAPQIVKRTVDP